jgi:ribosomal protein S18 acetylase RimI-like enzyme
MNTVKQLTKVSKLGKTDLREIRKLVDICKKADGFETKFYYNILKDRRIPEFDDFFYYLNGNLVGYLAIFCFKENEAEVSACVHPKNRHQGIFKRLFAEACDELSRRGIQDALLLVQHGTQPAETICEHYNAKFSHAEHEMTAKRFVEIPDLPEVILRDVTKDDAMELARIDAAGFDTDFNKMVYRFLNGMNDKDRTVWMATHNGENIGKVHVRFDDDGRGYIHDLCVPPEHRRKRYAMSMVQETLVKLKKMGFKVVYLDVEATNPNAIELYSKCGFETTAIHDFWRYPLKGVAS